MKELFNFIYFAQLKNVYEYEFDHVLLGEYGGEINPNEDEVEDYKWIEISELEKELVKNPKIFAPWFLISAPIFLDKIKNS